MTLDWSDVSGATSYRIQVDDSSTFSTPIVVDQTVTASQLTAPTLAVRRHWWRVRGDQLGRHGWRVVLGPAFHPAGHGVAPALSAVALNPTSVVGGSTSQGTATLTSAAPSGGAVVSLSSNNTSAATVPVSVTVAAGATGGIFTVGTVSVTASTSATVTGAFGGATRSATLTVTPPAAPASLSALSVSRRASPAGPPRRGDPHPDLRCPGGRVRRVAVEQQPCGDDARKRVGGSRGKQRVLRDRDERGHHVDARHDHSQRWGSDTNGDRDGDFTGAGSNADGDGDRPER